MRESACSGSPLTCAVHAARRAVVNYWAKTGLCLCEPPCGEGVALVATARLPHSLKIALSAQVLLWEEACGAWHRRGRVTGERLLPNAQALDDGQAFAALGAACGEHLAAAGGGFACAETNLTGALFAVWAESRLHRFESLRGDGSAEARGACQRRSFRTHDS